MNIETEFSGLNDSLEVLRPILGDDRYTKLVDMAARMRAHFEADPEDKTEDALAGRDIILQMEDLLKEVDDPADHPDYTGPRG